MLETCRVESRHTTALTTRPERLWIRPCLCTECVLSLDLDAGDGNARVKAQQVIRGHFRVGEGLVHLPLHLSLDAIQQIPMIAPEQRIREIRYIPGRHRTLDCLRNRHGEVLV